MSEDMKFSDVAYCYNCKRYDKEKKFCNEHHKKIDTPLHCIRYVPKEHIENKKYQMELAVEAFSNDFIKMVEKFYKIQPYFYDKSEIWWLWNFNKKCWEIIDKTDLFNSLRKFIPDHWDLTNSSRFSSVKRAFEFVGREKQPTPAPKTWIQFKDKIFDIKTKKIIEATPKYFICNPIPYQLGKTEETPMITKLFKQWVGKEYTPTLFEIIAYCCLTDYPIHLIFCFIGSGRNGKTSYQRLIRKFIGIENICSTELDILLDSRFESSKLFKKLVCLLGETNFGVMSKTSLLKKLTGQDLIGYEFKNKKAFDDINYATVLINSNSLPSSNDTSEGFYRRWNIIDFPNQFKEGKDIIQKIPEKELENLAYKITKILPKLLNKGMFTNQGTIEERQRRYILSSNPLSIFIEKFCITEAESYIPYSKLYNEYSTFLLKNKRRVVSRKEFSNILLTEGLEHRRTFKDGTRDYWVEGIRLKVKITDYAINFKEFSNKPLSQLSQLSGEFQLDFPYREISSKTPDKTDKTDKNKTDKTMHFLKEKVISALEQQENMKTKDIVIAVNSSYDEVVNVLNYLKNVMLVFEHSPDVWRLLS